jgi:hypothetical protein
MNKCQVKKRARKSHYLEVNVGILNNRGEMQATASVVLEFDAHGNF